MSIFNILQGRIPAPNTSSKSSTSEASTPFNPYQDSSGADWDSQYSDVLKSPTYDPSTFRTQVGQDGGFNLYSGDQLVSSFSDQNRMQDFVSQYSQGWKQFQGTQTPLDNFNELTGQYTFQTPSVAAPQVQVDQAQVSQDEIVDPEAGQLGEAPDVQAFMSSLTKASSPEEVQTALAEAAESAGGMEALMQQLAPALGQVSQQSQVQAAQAQLDKESTVQGQLENLMSSFEGGNPPWATGPMRAANAIMAQRGLSASSLAGQAITNAVMEASLPIAMADAQTSAEMQFANLSNLQQARIQNAQSFLSMDMANLNNTQQTQIFKAQQRATSLLSDTAARNAASQFNASSQNQSEQFMAQLATQVQQFNTQQANAMSQFNAGETNALSQFMAQMQNQRDQFNANNRLVIDQANAQWRQQITTLNNANVNEANRVNASNLLAVNLAEFNNISQARRDAMNYAYTASESAKDRAMQIVMSQVNADTSIEVANIRSDSGDSGSASLFEAAGNLIGSMFGG